MASTVKVPPSSRWSSFDGWTYNGMKERLETAIASLDKYALTHHAELLTGKKLTMSAPFSAGQSWMCFELIAEDGDLIIARIRLPRHPDTPAQVSEEDVQYAVQCEVATMEYVRQKAPSVRVPKIYAYERPGSELAKRVGASHMLIEGFYGNNLQDVAFDMTQLPIATQEHIITQWTSIQAELATLSFPTIGSISSISETGEPTIGQLSTAASECLPHPGPFKSSDEYFTSLATAAVKRNQEIGRNESTDALLAAKVFLDIVRTTDLFKSDDKSFPLNHMDLGPQNILVDDAFNFLAVIDWEFAQTAPWEVNYFPMPFPLLWSDKRIAAALGDPKHVAHKPMLKQAAARGIYEREFRVAERQLQKKGRGLARSFPDVLNGAASKIYGLHERVGSAGDGTEDLIREMVRLAFGLDEDETNRFLEKIVDRN